MAKLSEDAVRDIRRRRAAGELNREIAADYQVWPQLVSKVARGKLWGHIADAATMERKPK